MTHNMALINFKTLKGFPALERKLETEEFLAAAKEIVINLGHQFSSQFPETLGTLFTPVINDMNGNITKLIKGFEKDPQSFHYLEDLIILNLNVDNNRMADALLWLKRGLQMICSFFENVFNDKSKSETIKSHLHEAYEITLKRYHGIFAQTTFRIIYNWTPTRSRLFGKGHVHDENMQILEDFLTVMRGHLNRVDYLLKKYNLDN